MPDETSVWTLEDNKRKRQVAFMSKEQAKLLQKRLLRSLKIDLRVVEYRRVEEPKP